uniref:Lysozyme g n=1 Tax=Calidris pygmaea TaxID=425635 RepID=A0A8C3KGZ9_9CHAR
MWKNSSSSEPASCTMSPLQQFKAPTAKEVGQASPFSASIFCCSRICWRCLRLELSLLPLYTITKEVNHEIKDENECKQPVRNEELWINSGVSGVLTLLSRFQVDKRYHKIVGSWDSEEHLAQGTDILCEMIKAIEKKFPTWTKEQQLKGGISAYNAGPKNVQTYDRMDVGTTHNDYANDVVARAKFYKRNGY